MSGRRRRMGLIVLGTLLLGAVLLAACRGESATPAVLPVTGGDPEAGRRLIDEAYGCGTCHTIPGIPGADANVGPPLTKFAERHYIAGRLVNTPDNLVKWIMDPQEVEPGTAMPDMGVTEPEARDIAAYLYTLK